MKRLTKKYDDNSGYEVVENYAHDSQITLYDYPYDDYEECVKKLGKLEDIEDELGIDLIDLVSLVKDDFLKYIIISTDIANKNECAGYVFMSIGKTLWELYETHDYQQVLKLRKLESLTKEELENGK